MIAVMISMFIFALIGAISPGPVNIIATGSGANFGFFRTLPHVFGATCAYTLIVLLVGLGLSHWLTLFPQITHYLLYVGAAFLLYLSIKIATAVPSKPENNAIGNKPPSFIEGFLAQSLNPKAWLVSMSGVSLFVTIHSPASLYLLIFCIISFSVCFIGISTWAVIGHSIRRLLSTKQRQISFNVIMGLMLAGTVMSMLLSQ